MKTIEYNGQVVFKKIELPKFKRLAKEFSENEACFTFVNQGEYRVREQTSVLNVDSSTGLLAKCTNYFYENQTEDTPGCEGEALGIFLYPDIFQKLFNYDLTQSTYTVDYNLIQVHIDKLLMLYRDSINVLLDAPELADNDLIENKLREFVLLMTKRVGAPSELDFLASMFKPQFAEFEHVIESNLYADLNIDELSALCHMSASSFKRKFKKVYNEPPMKYINKLKINKATLLLKTSDLRISDIVFETGFDSISTFNRSFKAQLGQSPSEYRTN